MLVRLCVLDDFSWHNAPDMCKVLTSAHATLSDLLWYCLISPDEDSFNLRCDEDIRNLLDDLDLDDDTSSATMLANVSQSPFYRVSRSMFYAAHQDEYEQHFSNHLQDGLLTPYRLTDLEFTDSDLVINFSINHGNVRPQHGRRRWPARHQPPAAYPSGFTRV